MDYGITGLRDHLVRGSLNKESLKNWGADGSLRTRPRAPCPAAQGITKATAPQRALEAIERTRKR